MKVTISGCVGPGLIFEFTIDRRVVLLKIQLSHFYSLRAGLLVQLHPLETQIRHLENKAQLGAKAEPPLKFRNLEAEIYHQLLWCYYVSLYDVPRNMSV